jgi:hypothetical protein
MKTLEEESEENAAAIFDAVDRLVNAEPYMGYESFSPFAMVVRRGPYDPNKDQ